MNDTKETWRIDLNGLEAVSEKRRLVLVSFENDVKRLVRTLREMSGYGTEVSVIVNDTTTVTFSVSEQECSFSWKVGSETEDNVLTLRTDGETVKKDVEVLKSFAKVLPDFVSLLKKKLEEETRIFTETTSSLRSLSGSKDL